MRIARETESQRSTAEELKRVWMYVDTINSSAADPADADNPSSEGEDAEQKQRESRAATYSSSYHTRQRALQHL